MARWTSFALVASTTATSVTASSRRFHRASSSPSLRASDAAIFCWQSAAVAAAVRLVQQLTFPWPNIMRSEVNGGVQCAQQVAHGDVFKGHLQVPADCRCSRSVARRSSCARQARAPLKHTAAAAAAAANRCAPRVALENAAKANARGGRAGGRAETHRAGSSAFKTINVNGMNDPVRPGYCRRRQKMVGGKLDRAV